MRVVKTGTLLAILSLGLWLGWRLMAEPATAARARQTGEAGSPLPPAFVELLLRQQGLSRRTHPVALDPAELTDFLAGQPALRRRGVEALHVQAGEGVLQVVVRAPFTALAPFLGWPGFLARRPVWVSLRVLPVLEGGRLRLQVRGWALGRQPLPVIWLEWLGGLSGVEWRVPPVVEAIRVEPGRLLIRTRAPRTSAEPAGADELHAERREHLLEQRGFLRGAASFGLGLQHAQQVDGEARPAQVGLDVAGDGVGHLAQVHQGLAVKHQAESAQVRLQRLARQLLEPRRRPSRLGPPPWRRSRPRGFHPGRGGGLAAGLDVFGASPSTVNDGEAGLRGFLRHSRLPTPRPLRGAFTLPRPPGDDKGASPAGAVPGRAGGRPDRRPEVCPARPRAGRAAGTWRVGRRGGNFSGRSWGADVAAYRRRGRCASRRAEAGPAADPAQAARGRRVLPGTPPGRGGPAPVVPARVRGLGASGKGPSGIMGRPMGTPDTGQRFIELLDVMARLRGEGGCPWDRAQTRETLRPFLLEEAYEVVEALEAGDPAALREELGDLLFQVVFHVRLAEERGEFTWDELLDALIRKMVRRHPHVFADARVDTPQEALAQWEAIKQGEVAQRSVLDGVPRTLPALLRAQRVQDRAARVGFDWRQAREALAKVREELAELDEALGAERADAVEAELGDLLFAAVNVARLAGTDPERALQRAVERFAERFRRMEAAAGERGVGLGALSLEELEQLWVEAKARDSRA